MTDDRLVPPGGWPLALRALAGQPVTVEHVEVVTPEPDSEVPWAFEVHRDGGTLVLPGVPLDEDEAEDEAADPRRGAPTDAELEAATERLRAARLRWEATGDGDDELDAASNDVYRLLELRCMAARSDRAHDDGDDEGAPGAA